MQRKNRRKPARLSRPDVAVARHGSIVSLTPRSRAGATWLSENLDPDALRLGDGYAVEPRYIGPILEGISNDGLFISF